MSLSAGTQLSDAEFFFIDIRSAHMADRISDEVYRAEPPFANAHVGPRPAGAARRG